MRSIAIDYNPIRRMLNLRAFEPVAEDLFDEVVTTTRKFLTKDLAEWKIFRIEGRVSSSGSLFDFSSGQDLVFVHRREPRLKIVDWKRLTPKSPIKAWERKMSIKYLHGYQATYYIAAVAQAFAQVDFAKGIDYEVRVRQAGTKVAFRIWKKVSNPILEALKGSRDLVQLSGMVKSFKAIGPPWPKNNEACHAWGRECTWTSECWITGDFPTITLDAYPMTPTFRQTLMDCPEKYRRLSLYAQEHNTNVKTASDQLEGENQSASLGKLFHTGMQMVYQQAAEQEEL